jgi:hypothetical protein
MTAMNRQTDAYNGTGTGPLRLGHPRYLAQRDAARGGRLGALTQERQQLVRGPEPQLAPRIHFLDPAVKMPLGGACVRSQLEDEGPPHLMEVTWVAVGRCESHVEAGVQFPFKLHRLAKRAIKKAPIIVTLLWVHTFTPL